MQSKIFGVISMFIVRRLSRFALDHRGNIALLTALMLVPILIGVGGAIDYGRFVSAQNSLNSASRSAASTAVNVGRTLLAADPTLKIEVVQAAAQTQAASALAAQFGSGLSTTYQLSTVSLTRVGSTLSANVSYSASVPTTVMKLVGVPTLSATGTAATNGPLVSDTSDPNYIVRENFESAPRFGFYNKFQNWQSTQALEIGTAANYSLAAAEGTKVLELDGYVNTAASKKVYLPRGSYELRYWYADRVQSPAYAPAWICGSNAADAAWATNSLTSTGPSEQTNRIGVYLDVALNDTAPTTFTPETNNVIDVCTTSGHKWIERSVKVTINTPGYFWLTFQAEGVSDSYGGLIDDIRMCKNTCPGTLQDNFPWAANSVVFLDKFDNYSSYTGFGTLSVSGTNNGWSSLSTGWATAPVNQMDFWNGRTGLGLELDASGNRTIHKRFLLDPGYYQIQYVYSTIPSAAFGSNIYCGATAALASFSLVSAVADAYQPSWGTMDGSSSAVGVYMDADRSFAAPANPTGALNETAVWYNPDGSAYNSTFSKLPGQLIDFCSYSSSFTTRNAPVRIQKAGFYWLTFKAEGTSDGLGGMIDDVTITALGGPNMYSPPSGAVAITPAGLAAGATIVMGGVEIAVQ